MSELVSSHRPRLAIFGQLGHDVRPIAFALRWNGSAHVAPEVLDDVGGAPAPATSDKGGEGRAPMFAAEVALARALENRGTSANVLLVELNSELDATTKQRDIAWS